MVDRGDPTARLLFVGEAPGQSEDALGEAFIGAAGQLLDEFIAGAGLADRKFLIINILKCRPPENKFPGDKDSAYGAEIVPKCLPWLDKQIELVNPRVVVLVGRKAAEWTVFRNKRPAPTMIELFGRWIQSDRYPKVEFFGIYHTAYLLRLRQENSVKAQEVEEKMRRTLAMAVAAIDGVLPELEPMLLKSPASKSRQLKFF